MKKTIIGLFMLCIVIFIAQRILRLNLQGQVFHFIVILIIILALMRKYKYHLFALPIAFHFNFTFFFSANQFFDIFSLAEIIIIFVTLLLLQNVKIVTPDKSLIKHRKTAMFYIITCFVINLFLLWKRLFVYQDTGNFFWLFRRTLNFSMYSFMFYTLFQRINTKKLLKVFDASLIAFAIIFSFSTIIYNPLYERGIDIAEQFESTTRNAGIFSGSCLLRSEIFLIPAFSKAWASLSVRPFITPGERLRMSESFFKSLHLSSFRKRSENCLMRVSCDIFTFNSSKIFYRIFTDIFPARRGPSKTPTRLFAWKTVLGLVLKVLVVPWAVWVQAG